MKPRSDVLELATTTAPVRIELEGRVEDSLVDNNNMNIFNKVIRRMLMFETRIL
ncbi:TPA: hypothetical protein NHV36_006117 [Klebsiella michiganensis]|uniref:hypothetical protein n=1 Tax=Klebsiella michiganensis TaxID=1134687 RepID=UPI000D543614|nr:hypothetical protein [Klebsiella michiganensis]QLX18572.1 hypothetical protein HV230_28920 [Klebsiella oxytoca]AWF56218.1 hypothetical protein CSC12_6310 [Klebsiella michiganensis]MDU7883561.1 hypothetical protein [Klebsiella michiganensis]HCE8860665.1 hypothetical protein [Klebsiella michiganensis]HCE9047090.1 hypothetical protein [Klebsiella michiganensis]